MAVDLHQVEMAVIVEVEEGDAEAERMPGRAGQAEGSRVVGEESAAEIVVEGRALAVEVGDGQVGPGVAVEVAAGDAHSGLEAALRVAGEAGLVALFLEAEIA